MEDVKKVVKKLNELLKPFQFAIKFRLCEDTNEEHFVLLNLNETAAAKQVFLFLFMPKILYLINFFIHNNNRHTSEFTQPEFDLLKLILEEIVTSDSGTVSSIDCINFSSSVQKLSKSDAQQAMEKFISSQWLKEVFSVAW